MLCVHFLYLLVAWAALYCGFGEHPFCDSNGVPDLKTACCHHAVMVGQEHCCSSSLYRQDALLLPNFLD